MDRAARCRRVRCRARRSHRDRRPGTGRYLQEPRPARHALLRRQQRPRRRRAEGSRRSWRDPVDAGLRLHAGRRPGRLSERLQAVHRYLGAMHRQARGLLPGAVELGRDRGDALRPPARRRLLDRADRVCRQSRRRGAVRRQGHREGPARLSPARHGQDGQPVPEALRPQGQARRPYRAVVELRAISRRCVLYPPGRAQAERGLQAADVGRPRQVGARRRFRRLRHGAASPPTCSSAW